jgi:enterochelin esterase family protein
MNTPRFIRNLASITALGTSFHCSLQVFAQAPAQNRPPPVVSPEVDAERNVTFRIRAAKAESVQVSSGDLGLGQGNAMTKGENEVWEVKVGPANPGAYRYNFNVDGVSVIDPRNPKTSESNDNTWSLLNVSGSEFMDTKEVPHGSVAEITYWSSALNRFRRLHAYTPPGYELGEGKFPVFYLLHGASDSDNSWSTVGRAGFILDNLIAAGKAKPMVVIMPAGHTGPLRSGVRSGGEFEKEFTTDIMPLVEKRFRVHTDRANRALAGLSMGGMQTLSIGIPNLEQFGYLGVYSSGIFGIAGGQNRSQPEGPSFEEKYTAILDDAQKKEGLKVFWFATGKDDFLVETSRATVAMFKKHNFNVNYKESNGGHTWVNWREYLNEFAPMLFQ